MTTILSGIRPTAGIHLGNYLGALKQWIALSREKDTRAFFMIADYHALAPQKNLALGANTLDLLAWEMAAGLDPHAVTLFLQSAVPAHTELSRILAPFVTVAELTRMTQYKDLAAQGLERPTAALLDYPVLQAADVLLYQADLVPIGEDQLQHLELIRSIARRVNRHIGKELFVIPKARLTATKRVMSLDDPEKKMAKSLPRGALMFEDSEKTLRAKVTKAVTDPSPATAPFPDELMTQDLFSLDERILLFSHMTPGVRNLFLILQETSQDDNLVDTLLHNYRNQTLQYRDLKAQVAKSVVGFILPLQESFRAIRSQEEKLGAILHEGSEAAQAVANKTLHSVKEALGLLLV